MTNSSTSAAEYFAAVTPHDSNNLPSGQCRGIYIGGVGNLTVLDAGGTPITFTALAVGVVDPSATARILSTGTTATAIIALY